MSGLNGTDLAALPEAEKRARARQMALEDPTLRGADLNRLFGMKDRWGRKQAQAARTGTPAGTSETVPRHDSGTPAARSNGTKTVPERAAPEERRAARPRAAAQPTGPTVPAHLLALAAVSVGMVTVVCAVVNYFHVRDLATVAGMGGLAGWLPLGVDGLVVASTCSVIADRHLKQPVEPLAVVGVVLGLAGSLAANVLAVDPELVSLRAVRWVLAGYSPAALAVSVHLFVRMFAAKGKA